MSQLVPVPAPPWQRPVSRRSANAPLNRDVIVDAALAVLDREGSGAVTMRRVAQELNTGPASLYAHVNGKEDLENQVFDRIAAEVPIPVTDPSRWREQVKELLTSQAEVFSRHPGAAAFAMARIPYGPNALDRMEAMLSLLRAGGVDDQVAAFAADLLYLYVTAHAYEEGLARSQGRTEVSERLHHAQLEEYFKKLPTARFPNLVALSTFLFNLGGSPDGLEEHQIDRFQFGLDVLIAGLTAVAMPQKKTRPKKVRE
jgi:AcrR family transcriptional regulator